MARPSKAQRWADVHGEALKEFDKIYSASEPVRRECLADRRFYSVTGAQWEGDLGDQYENKPRFELNKVHLAVIRIVNEYRNNRVTVTFTPKDGDEDKTADTCNGLFRADEQSSTAEEAYDNGFEEAASGGIGAWRLRAHYEDDSEDEDERQRICIEPIHDADSCVFFDLDAKRQDKSDAKRCYVLTPMSIDAYKDEYGDDPNDWPKNLAEYRFEWATPDVVWLCELFIVEEHHETVRFFAGIDGEEMRVPESEFEDDPKKLEELLATGFKQTRQKRVKTNKVRKYLFSGSRILEDCGLIAGKHIPIVPVFGKRWVVDGVERCMGHVRLAKDAQRLTNMLMSWLAEMAARFDVEKPILTPDQIAGHVTMWAEDNIKKFPYLLLNPVMDAGGNPMPAAPVGYTKAPQLPPSMAALAEIAEASLQDLLGNQQAGEEIQPNLSGRAVELIQQRLDMQVFIYMSNFARAMKRTGEIWLSMMKDIAVEEGRKMKTLTADGEISSATINNPIYNEETDSTEVENDISKASFDVFTDVGPSSSTKRQATVRALTGMMSITQDPEMLMVLGSMAMMNMDGEGISEVRSYYRKKLVRMGVIEPTKEEAQQLAEESQNQQPDPQSVYLQQAAEAEAAKAQESRANVVDKMASAEKKQAETAKIREETHSVGMQRHIDVADAFMRAATPPKQDSKPQ